jgi:antitoxin YefM
MPARRPSHSPRPVRPVQDVRALTEFRANVAAVLQQVQSTGRPVILTQHGKSAAVLLDPAAYEALIEELELLRDIQEGERQSAAGEALAHGAARKQLLQRLR